MGDIYRSPNRYEPPAKGRHVAVNSMQWVQTSALAPIRRTNIFPPEPTGQQFNPPRYLFRDARVAVNSQSWVGDWTLFPAALQPVFPAGRQTYPDRFRPLSAYVAFYSQHWMNYPSRTQKGNAHFGQANTGVFNAVGTVSNRTVGSFPGTGAFNAVGLSVFSSQFSMTGSGAFSARGAVAPATPAVASFSGAGVFTAVSRSTAASVFTATGSGSFNAIGTTPTTRYVAARWAGVGTFKAHGLFRNVLPFNYPPSWSHMIYGPIIEGVGYDPVTRNLKVWFTGHQDQYIILQNLGFQVTNQIANAPNPEAFVLALIASTPGVPLPPTPT